jgi:outer membrane beta-barrel protein
LRRLGDRIKSVQRKVFAKRMRHELMVQASTSLNDAFFQQFTVGGAYTFHPLEWLALEANAKYFLPPLRTDLTTVIRSTPAAGNIQIYSPILTLTADVQFAPIYGKLSVFAEQTIHYDFYISGGFGAILTENAAAPWHPLGTVALGARVMATEWLTIRFEIKDAIYNDTRSSIVASAIQNMLLFNLGVSFFLPPTFDYRSE